MTCAIKSPGSRGSLADEKIELTPLPALPVQSLTGITRAYDKQSSAGFLPAFINLKIKKAAQSN
jgi:hypothetical protein